MTLVGKEMNVYKIPERIKKNIEYYQFNEEGSKSVNKRYEELMNTQNLRTIIIELYPNYKNPTCFLLLWEKYVR